MIRIIALTEAGQTLANSLCKVLDGDVMVHYKPQPFAEMMQSFFQQGDRLICICATGIVMRTLAPVLVNKHRDPAVLVLDEQGQFIIPLLSGHEGGANHWASQIAMRIGAQLVVTTANPYLNPIYTLGMGCERHCPLEYLEALMLQGLEQAKLDPDQVVGLHSIDIKADETNLVALAKKYGWPFTTYSAEQLSSMESLLSSRSDYVYNTVGVYGVAESAALLGAQVFARSAPELVLNKIKNTKATCAVARAFQHTHKTDVP